MPIPGYLSSEKTMKCKNRHYETSIMSKLKVQNRQKRLFAILELEIAPNNEKSSNARETCYPAVFWRLDSIFRTFESIRWSCQFLWTKN